MHVYLPLVSVQIERYAVCIRQRGIDYNIIIIVVQHISQIHINFYAFFTSKYYQSLGVSKSKYYTYKCPSKARWGVASQLPTVLLACAKINNCSKWVVGGGRDGVPMCRWTKYTFQTGPTENARNIELYLPSIRVNLFIYYLFIFIFCDSDLLSANPRTNNTWIQAEFVIQILKYSVTGSNVSECGLI